MRRNLFASGPCRWSAPIFAAWEFAFGLFAGNREGHICQVGNRGTVSRVAKVVTMGKNVNAFDK